MLPEPDSARIKPSAAVYYSYNIGRGAPASSTIYGFLVEGKDSSGGVPALIVSNLLKWGARIQSHTGYLSERSREFTLSLTCDLGDADRTPDDLLIQIRKMKNVTRAESVSLRNQLFDGLLFPLVLMDTNRVVAIDSRLMFEIQEKLKSQAEKSGLEEAGRDYGVGIVTRIKQKFEANKNTRSESAPDSVIIENVTGYLKAAGWGKFSWESEESCERVVIQDPPTSSKEGSGAGNLFLQGLMAGITEAFQNKRLGVMEDHYDIQARRLTATLVEQSRIKSVEPTREETLSQEQKTMVLGEIEKMISSVEGKVVGEEPAEKLVAGQKLGEKPVEVAINDFGRVQVSLKRKSRDAAPGSSNNTGENAQPVDNVSTVKGINNLDEIATKLQEKVKVESALKVPHNETPGKPLQVDPISTGNLAHSDLNILVKQQKLEATEAKSKRKALENEAKVESSERTLEDLKNENDVSLTLFKRKRVPDYAEDNEYADFDDSDTSFESSQI